MDVIFPPTPACPEAAYSYVIGENNFVYPAMSGHNTICVVTALLESGMVRNTCVCMCVCLCVCVCVSVYLCVLFSILLALALSLEVARLPFTAC